MKIKYLGTGAAEGIPALYCDCNICNNARRMQGKEIRTRAQALIDEQILLDFGPDSFWHSVRFNVNYGNIFTVLITHTHEDHLFFHDIYCRKRNRSLLPKSSPPMTIYGSKGVRNELNPDENGCLTKDGTVCFKQVSAYSPLLISDYRITAFPAVHKTEEPLIYAIENSGSTILYCHDSDMIPDEVLAWMAENGYRFDMVSLDCTEGNKHIDYQGHMNFERDQIMRKKLLDAELANSDTIFVASHFSHNGLINHSEAEAIARSIGFIAAYDGLEIEV